MDQTPTVRRRGRGRSGTAVAVVSLFIGGVLLVAPAAQAVDGGIDVTSTDMTDGTALNPMFACSGFPFSGTLSPQLQWGDAPEGTIGWAVLMHDELSATPNTGYDAAQGDWAHWGVYNIPVATTSLARNASQAGQLGGGTQAANTWNALAGGEQRYLGPCPPSGDHDYYVTVYALDAALAPVGTGLNGEVTTADMLAAMQGHVLDQGDLRVGFSAAEVGTTLLEVEFAQAEIVIDEAGTTTATGPFLLVNGSVGPGGPVTVMVELTDSPAGGTPAASYDTDFSYTGGRTQTVTIPTSASASGYDGTLQTAIDLGGLFTGLDDALVEGTESLTFQLSIPAGTTGVAIGNAGHSGEVGRNARGEDVVLDTMALLITDDEQGAGPTPANLQQADAPEETLPRTGRELSEPLLVAALAMLAIGIVAQVSVSVRTRAARR